MIRIADYDHSIGGLAHGLEDGQNTLIVRNFAMSDENESNYRGHCLYLSESQERDEFDMFIASPWFGDKIGRRGSGNFDLTDLHVCFDIISKHLPDYILIAVSQPAITYLQIEKTVTETYEGIPTNDLVIARLKEMGYTSQYFTIDPVSYRLPQHKITGFYFSAKKEIFDKPLKLPYTTYDKEESASWRWLQIMENKVMNFHDPDFSKKDVCALIAQGSNAKRSPGVSVTKGYQRLQADQPAPRLALDFYRVSSSGPSIHPIFDRPLTIREGALLSGIPETYGWDPKMKKPVVAKQIIQSTSPIIGNKIRMGLLKAIG